jgi:hypothetical protein
MEPATRSAATRAPYVGPAVRDGSQSAATVGRSRHGEHPGAGVSMAATLRILHQSVRSRISRARSRLRRALGHVDPSALREESQS